ncbi:MAG: sugar transporter [Novosphingobium pentaromativorans]|uniref:Sugar transporter n=1 Tax=Novosphingobium pentaromativorans TaxID=205844 RepID=A0A2W5NPY4_9SPHN|nr:MAG: sugar transporter [Novosphingobium pentaromativorans]
MRKFRVIAVLILLWNILGDAAYLMQATADLDEIARRDPVQAQAFREMPGWAWAAYAVAVTSGTIGAIVLLMRRGWAWALFALSFLAVIVQFGWTFLGFDLLGAKGPSAAIFPLLIVAIALASTIYARRKKADGTLK